MKYWKKILPITMAFTLTIQPAAYAELIIPPVPITGGSTAGIFGPGSTGSGLGSGTLPAPGITDSAAGSSWGPGAADSQPGNSGTSAAADPSAGTQQSSTSAGTTATDLTEPEVSCQGAVLMDAATGKVLFGKNQDQQFYPASITKVMTALLVIENCDLNETVTFSSTATTNLESGAVSLGVSEGDQLTVEQSLYGLLLKSANEIGNGLAEHVAGSISAFADMMNARARELGCKNTNFVNPHGLNNANHKTTPYDMALILRAALQYDTFRKIDTTLTYEFPALKNAAARTITMGHKMMYPSDSRYYEGIIGGKTGYTSLAGNTLVTGVERNGVRLIAVVMKSSSTHYQDTKAMLDYGFANYAALMGADAGQNDTSGAASAVQPVGPGSGTSTSGSSTVSGSGTITGGSSTVTSGSATGSSTIASGSAVSGTGTGVSAGPGAQTEGEGWHQNSSGWYYIKSGTRLTSAWVESSGKWYYLGSDGIMLTSTTTPDGYQVDENGVWIQ